MTERALPKGFRLWQDRDGDWWLEPPATVTIYSEPGESVLLGRCSRELAMDDALAYLRGVPHAA